MIYPALEKPSFASCPSQLDRQTHIARFVNLSHTNISTSYQLRLATRPDYDSDDDAFLHSQLMGLDFLDAVSTWSSAPARVYVDKDTLSKITNPVNLHMHHHEELMARTGDELNVYNKAMEEPDMEKRKNSIRQWYHTVIQNATTTNTENQGGTLEELNLDHLCSQIEQASTVKYFGGSSLYLLQRLHERKLAHKIQCYMQAVRVLLPLWEYQEMSIYLS